MGLWDDFVNEVKNDPQAERIKQRELKRHDALLVARAVSTTGEVRPKRLLVFEDRVEVHDPGFFKVEVKALRYTQIANVRLESRLLRADLSIESTGGEKIGIQKLPKGEAQAARALIEEKLSERDAGDSSTFKDLDAAGGTMDIPEQIRKLAELRDAGVLTEEEFAEKKAELLKRL